MLPELVQSKLMAQSHISVRKSRVVLQNVVHGEGLWEKFQKARGFCSWEILPVGPQRVSSQLTAPVWEERALLLLLYFGVK